MKVMVSGTYDLLHAGHIQFFKDARALGDYLVVTFCSAPNLLLYKGYEASMPDDNKQLLLESIRYIDKVNRGSDDGGIFDFLPAFEIEKPDILAVTEDDRHKEEKKEFCDSRGVKFVVLPKRNLVTQVSSFGIAKKVTEQVLKGVPAERPPLL